jgi:hypothetical protein
MALLFKAKTGYIRASIAGKGFSGLGFDDPVSESHTHELGILLL